MERIYLNIKETDGKDFYFADFGKGKSYPDFRLWVAKGLVKSLPRLTKEQYLASIAATVEYLTATAWDYIEFPLQATLQEGKSKNTIILKPAENKIVYHVLVPCGFRGGSSFDILSPVVGGYRAYPFGDYESPRGNLGISTGALVEVPAGVSLKIAWQKSGRLYGAPSEGVSIYHPDGTIKDEEEEEAIKELENC